MKLQQDESILSVNLKNQRFSFEFLPISPKDKYNKLENHIRVLNSFGVNDLSNLGTLKLNGAIIPQPGILLPHHLREHKPKPSSFKNARIPLYKIKDQDIGGSLKTKSILGKAKKLSGHSYFIYGHSEKKYLKKYQLKDIPSSLFNSAMPINFAYWAATTIELQDNATIILQQPHRFLVIIAESIEIGENVTITWQRESKGVPSQPATPERPPTAERATNNYPSTGTQGTPGTKGGGGHEGDPGPEIEIWTLKMEGENFAIDVQGQDGCPGGIGGNGGQGGCGQPGKLRGSNCDSPAGRSGWGGTGGAAGNGGDGGNGGHGGRFSLYAPGDIILDYAEKGFYINASGGTGGRGGQPGLPGQGGPEGVFDYGHPDDRCENDGTPGGRGSSGAIGSVGSDGEPGRYYTSALSLIPINPDKFHIKLSLPYITNLSHTEGRMNDQVQLFGDRFTETDEVYIGNNVAQTSFISEQELMFIIPSTQGGSQPVVVKQSDGTLSNRATIVIMPVLTSVEQNQNGTIVRSNDTGITLFDTETEITLVGSGFAPGAHIQVLSEYIPGSLINYISPQRITCLIHRPVDTPVAPNEADATGDNGELIDIRVILSTGEMSPNITIRLRPYKILVVGDSIVWGQGLKEAFKFHSLVEEFVKENRNVGVYKIVHAHSGAIIGNGTEALLPALNGEVNNQFPTIIQQLENYGGNNEIVSLILMDGGINDVELMNILNFISGPNLEDAIEEFIEARLDRLLRQITGLDNTNRNIQFPHSRIIVTGYYQIVSEYSDLDFIKIWLYACFGPSAPLFYAFDELTGWSDSQIQKLSDRCRLFANLANETIDNIITRINRELGLVRVYFANPDFQVPHAIFSTQSLLWGLSSTGNPEDISDNGGVYHERINACSSAPSDRLNDSRLICNMASVGHPNVEGAIRYANSIFRLPFLT